MVENRKAKGVTRRKTEGRRKVIYSIWVSMGASDRRRLVALPSHSIMNRRLPKRRMVQMRSLVRLERM
jgi:hypothetical protein